MKNCIIGVVNTKGGVGKTTTSLCLATLFAKNNYKTELIDTDTQASLTEWIERIEEQESIPFEFSIGNKRTIANLKNKEGIFIIDTPPHNSDIIQNVIDVADFIIIPTTPSAMDLDRVWSTISSVDENYGVLITTTQPRTKTHKLTKEILEEENINHFEAYVPRLEKLKSMFGTLPDNVRLTEYQKVYEELLSVIDQ